MVFGGKKKKSDQLSSGESGDGASSSEGSNDSTSNEAGSNEANSHELQGGSANSNEFEARDADFSELDESQTSSNSKGSVNEADSKNSPDLDRLKAELAETKDKYLRSLAEFENYKKRSLKERSDLLKYQGERVFLDVLSVLDNIELALTHSDAEPEKLLAGLQLIHKQFVDVLGRWEVRGDSSLGKEFDPVRHQAISKMILDDTKPGTIIGELKKAYFYKDKLLRPGDVVVAVERSGEEQVSSDEAPSETSPQSDDVENLLDKPED